tara:strand:+ start:477 stop:980 length:504 start_codon:yes stop_codon:yes gene_type:complete
MKAKKKTLYGSMKDGGRLTGQKVKDTPAQRKKKRVKRRADRKGVDTKGMTPVYGSPTSGKTATERDDRKRDVFNPIKADRAERKASKAASKVGARLVTPKRAGSGFIPKKKKGGQEKYEPRVTKEMTSPSEGSKARLVAKAQRKYNKYKKVMGKQGDDPRMRKPKRR